MRNARPLRAALAANAIFSISCGTLLILNPALAGELLGIHAPVLLRLLGVGLVLFAVDLFHQATRARMVTWRALVASIGDFVWVAGSIVLIAFFTGLFTSTGLLTILAVAGMVFVFGAWQVWAINHLHKVPWSGMYRHCIMVNVNAPASAMWKVVGDLGGIKNHMRSLKSSEVLDGKTSGPGAVRRCVNHAGKAWSEACVEFVEGRSFTVRFLTEAHDFPFPATKMIGGWEVTPAAKGSNVMVWWELQPKPALLAPLLLPLLAFQADRDFPGVITQMARHALAEDSSSSAPSPRPTLLARFVPKLC